MKASDKFRVGTVEKLDPENKNMGVAAGIFFLSRIELEKPLGVILPPTPVVTNVCKNRWVYEVKIIVTFITSMSFTTTVVTRKTALHTTAVTRKTALHNNSCD